MKKFHYFLVLAILLSSCGSSTKYLQRGDYDAAIDKAVKVLLKNPDKSKEITNLQTAFALANQNDQDAINQLKMSGQPDIYDEIHYRYSRLHDRQEVVERLPGRVLDRMGFRHIDYNETMAESKKKAAAFLYAHAESQLKDGDKLSARSAYDELMKVKEYYAVYRDVDLLIKEALYLGTNNVLFQFSNESDKVIPADFEEELLKISLEDLRIDWINFDTYPQEDLYYDYSIYLNLKDITTSPEFVKEEHHTETREVEDGFDYALDENGNVKKDSLGNDIKIPRIMVISCDVIEAHLYKNVVVSGVLDFYNNTSKQLEKTETITIQSNFDHRYAVAHGNLDALSKKTRKMTKRKPVPFPSDAQMIYDTNNELKERAKNIISRNWRILLD